MLQLKAEIQNSGLKATPQRIAILGAMHKLGHASADMVADQLKDIFPSLTVATIYNVLESFVEKKIVVRRFSSNNKMYFEVNTYAHAHLYFKEENRYVDYDEPELLELVNDYFKNRKIPGFKIDSIDIQIVGSKSE